MFVTALVGYTFPKPLLTCYCFHTHKKKDYKTYPKFFFSPCRVTANQNAYFRGLYYSSSTAATAMSNLIPALTFVFAAIAGYWL